MVNPEISVLVPVFNERDNLRPLFDELESVLSKLGISFEVIAIDDGSQDGSTELLKKLASEKNFLKVLIFRSNTGQTAAFDAGFRNASGKYVITMDADLQNDPADIPKMLQKLTEGYDFVAGWRKNRQDGFFLRKIPSKIANQLIRTLRRSSQHDLGCSLKAYRREIVKELKLYGEMHRFIGVIVEGMGARVTEIEVNHRPRKQGQSKYNLTRTFKVLLDLVTVWFLQGYRTKPIYVFGGVGAVLFLLSGTLASWVVWEKLANEFSVNRNPLFTLSIFLSVLGIQFFVLGLLAELVIRTYFESSQEPPYSISTKIGFEPSQSTEFNSRQKKKLSSFT